MAKRPSRKHGRDRSEPIPTKRADGNTPDGVASPDELDIAVRGYAERSSAKSQPSNSNWKSAPPSVWTLVFDTETTIDPSQRLRFGTYRTYEGDKLDESGIFYVPDDPKALSAKDITVIKAYGARHNLTLRTTADFVDNVFYEIGYLFRGTIVGFNLPFDISRLAIGHDAARAATYTPKDRPDQKITNRAMVGGFTFKLSQHPRANVRIKHRSSKDAFYGFVSLMRGGRVRRGFFVDVKTIATAILGNQGFTLSKLADELQVEHRKLQEDKHGERITDRYLDYAVQDTLATWDCYRELRNRYVDWKLTKTPLHTLHSEASIGKAYLKQMGVKPLLEVQPEFSREILGHILSSYFGGRSEVHIRRKVTRILYCDFLSMYPTVSVLMGLWRWVIADGVNAKDATAEIKSLLKRVSLVDLQSPAFWPSLTALVQVEADDDIFPVRAKYGVDDQQYRLALNRLSSKTPLWFTLADCIASRLLTGRTPKVLKAYRFAPKAVQAGLSPIDIAGNSEYRVDPSSEDFYKRLVDLRRDIQRRAKSTAVDQKSMLEHEQLAIKNVASATTYGIFIELNVEDERQLAEGKCYGIGEPFDVDLDRFEKPGAYFHALVAVFTTCAARLMLATAEALAIKAGLNWAFCDTDSMALAKPDDMPDAEFLKRANGVRDWFTPLNPYSQKGPVFKIEDDNYGLEDGKLTDKLEPLYCYAISPKRYVLFNIDINGRPIIRKALAHGLGHLLKPQEPDVVPPSIPQPIVPLAKMEVDAWQYCLWYRIAEAALAGTPDRVRINDLPGFNQPAATRYGASTPDILAWCKGYNQTRQYRDRIQPFNFMLRFYAGLPMNSTVIELTDAAARKRLRAKTPQPLRPIAPYNRSAAEGAKHCFDRSMGKKVARSQLSTYAQELAQYHIHPDSKFAHAEYFDSGATQRRHIHVRNVQHIGKEADNLEEQIDHGVDPDAVMEYGSGSSGERLTLEHIRSELKVANLSRMRVASGVSRQRLTDIRDGKINAKRNTLRKVVSAIARLRLEDADRATDVELLLEYARAQTEQTGLRKFARELGIDHSTLAQILSGSRVVSDRLSAQLELLRQKPLK